VKDEETEVEEEEGHEDDLGHKLGDDIHGSLEEPMVPQTHHHAEQHVGDADDDGHLHLVRIQEVDLVLGQLPHGVHANWVRRVVVGVLGIQHHLLLPQDVHVALWDVPLGAEQVERL